VKILQTGSFSRRAKKLPPGEKAALDKAVGHLLSHPQAGEPKRADLAGVRVYKFKLGSRLYLLAYLYDQQAPTLTLLAIGSHESDLITG